MYLSITMPGALDYIAVCNGAFVWNAIAVNEEEGWIECMMLIPDSTAPGQLGILLNEDGSPATYTLHGTVSLLPVAPDVPPLLSLP